MSCLSTGVAASALLALPLAAQAGRTHRVNEPFPLIAAEDVDEFGWSSDGAWLAYWVTEPHEATLYCRAADASTPAIALYTHTPGQQRSEPRFLLGDDEIVFELRANNRTRVYLVPRDGSSAAVQPLGGETTSWALTPDESRFVYVADAITDERFVLLSRLRSGGAAIVLSGPLVAGGDVFEFRITEDATRVVYRASEVAGIGLHSAPIASPGSSVFLTPGMTAFDAPLVLTADRVVFRGRAQGTTRDELFSVPIAGGGPVTVVSHGVGHGEVTVEDDFALTTGGARAVFRSDAFVDGKLELFSALVDGSAAPAQLSLAMPDAADVAEFLLSQDGADVAWRADASVAGRSDLYVAPSDGSAPASVLAVPAAEQDVNRLLLFDPDGERVVFLAGKAGMPTQKLLVVPVDASAPPLQIDDRLSDLELASPAELAGDGERLVYRRFVGDGQELSVARLDGLTAPVRLAAGDHLGRHAVAPVGGHVAFAVDATVDTVGELFTRPLDGSTPTQRVSQDFAPTEPYGAVFGIAPSGVFSLLTSAERVVYVADQDTSGRTGLYSAPLHVPGPRLLLSDTTGGRIDVIADGRIELAAGGTRVLWRGWTAEKEWLFSSRLERALDPVVLNVAPQPYATIADYAVAPNGLSAVFLSDHEVDERFELYAAPLAVQGAPVKLSGNLVTGGDVQPGYQITPSGARVVYVADQETDGTFELYSSTGVGAPTKLSGALLGTGVHPDFQLSRDGSRVYFMMAALTNPSGFYQVPTDGSSGRLLLSSLSMASIEAEADQDIVLFRAAVGGVVNLMAADGTGAGTPYSLSGSLTNHHVSGVLLTPDLQTVLFHASFVSSNGIYAVPVTGGTPVKLTHNLPAQGQVTDLHDFPGRFRLTPDGTRLVYRFTSGGSSELRVVPIDASSPPVLLNSPGDTFTHFFLDPTSTWAFFGLREIWRVPLDLSAPAQRVLSVDGGLVQDDAAFVPDGSAFVLRRFRDGLPRDLFVNHLDDGPVGASHGTPTDVVTRTH